MLYENSIISPGLTSHGLTVIGYPKLESTTQPDSVFAITAAFSVTPTGNQYPIGYIVVSMRTDNAASAIVVYHNHGVFASFCT